MDGALRSIGEGGFLFLYGSSELWMEVLKDTMFYVYILKSIRNPEQRYIGYTNDLKKRFQEHNSGTGRHTSKYLPWRLDFYAAFSDRKKAMEFEKYLKSGSGHSFAYRHF